MDPFGENRSADTETELFGRKLALPLICAPVGSLKFEYKPSDNVCDFNEQCMAACESRGVLHAYGTGLAEPIFDSALESARRHSMSGFPVINPVADETIAEMLSRCSGENTPCAACIVLDSSGLSFMKTLGGSAGSKTIAQLRALKKYCSVPMVYKGIMSAKAAEKALDAGADAIIVSNHGGRVLSDTPATAEVLPEIVRAVGGRAKIIVDGGIRSGLDIFKALALGADAAMICRPIIIAYYGGGREGIECYIDKLHEELRDTMFMCGARSIADISADMVR